MKKIIIVGPLPPPYYGLSVATEVILRSQHRKRFEFIHLDTSDSRQELNFGKFDLGNIYFSLKNIFKLFWMLVWHRPHIVYIPISQGFLGYIRDAAFIYLSAFWKAKIVLHLRGGYFRTFYQNSLFPVKWLISNSISLAERMIVLGESMRSIFDGLFPAEKLCVVPNGVDPDRFELRCQGLEKNGRVRVCFLSNLYSTKGYMETLKAVERLASSYNVEVVFAGEWGSSTEKERTLAYIKKKSLEHIAKFVGIVKGEEKKKFLASSDIFVFPTYFPLEGLPWVVLEAMASGLPVVTTDHGCIAEVVADGVTGFIVPKKNVKALAEKLKKLISDSQLRLSMGQKGRERVERVYSEENFIRGLSRIFSQL